MFRKKEPLESITITFDPPPDGTYPPRILSPGWTTWLNEDEIPLQHGALIRRRNGTFTLYQHKCKKDILVNGHAIMELHILKDGDHIRIGNWVAIYQQDPVADYRQYMAKVASQITLDVTKKVRENFIADDTFISFDGGATKVSWDKIASLHFWNNRGWFVEIHSNRSKKDKLPSKLKKLTNRETDVVMNLLDYYAPFALSHFIHQSYPQLNMNDAYTIITYHKIIIPSNNNNIPLFDDPEHILGYMTPIDVRRVSRIVFIFFVVSSMVVLTYNARSEIESWGELGHSLALYLIMSLVIWSVVFLGIFVFIRVTDFIALKFAKNSSC